MHLPVLDDGGRFTLPWYRKFQDFSSSSNTGGITQLVGAVTALGPGIAIAALSATGVTPGAYTNLNATIGADGRITLASSGTSGGGTDTLSLLGASVLDGYFTSFAANKWAHARTASFTGDATGGPTNIDGSANWSTALTLATVNANVGTFTNATVTVNAKGLVTAAATGAPAVPYAPLTDGAEPIQLISDGAGAYIIS